MFFKRREGRRQSRLNIYHLAKYQRLGPESGAHLITCSIKDLGTGGVCFFSEENLPVSTVLQLYINFPQFSQPITTLAKVIWSKKLGKDNRFEIGVQFLDIQNIFQELINKRLDSVSQIVKERRKGR